MNVGLIKTKIEKRIKRCVIEVVWRERKTSFGNSDSGRKYYIVRRASKVQGLFSYVFTNLVRIENAVQRGYIPVVDMKNYRNSFQEENQFGKINAWELFFEQPLNVSLDDIASEKNITLGHGGTPEFIPNTTEEFLNNPKEFLYWSSAMKKYVRPNRKMQDYIINRKKKLFPENCRVVGVLGRGTDYTATKPYMHPIQPEVSDLIAKTREVMKEHSCTHVFLATEDEGVYREFKNAFGEQLIVNQDVRYENTGKKLITEMSTERKNDKYLTGRDYLTSVFILSQCNCLVAGKTSGSLAALLLSEGYEYSYLFNLGFYGMKDNEQWNIRG